MTKKKIDLSSINLHDKKATKKFTQHELYTTFENLFKSFFKNREKVYAKKDLDSRLKGLLNSTKVFSNYYIAGTNIHKEGGHSHRGHGHSRHKIMSCDQFLSLKHNKIDLLEGILNLEDYNNLLYILLHNDKPEKIPNITNATLRREALNFYGIEKFFKEMNTKLVDQEGKQQLLTLNWHRTEEPLTMVKVIDSTTKDVYLLRVPPDMKKVKDAIAWTFEMSRDEYRPIKET